MASLTVSFNRASHLYELKNPEGEVISSRVTPGGMVAECQDNGMTQQDAMEQVAVANRVAWSES